MKVILTREAGKNAEARAWLPSDARVVEVPLTSTEYFAIDEVTRQLQTSPDYGSFEVLVVTSRRTADYIHAALGAMAEGADLLTVGTKTTHSLRDRGVEVSAEATSSALELDGLISQGPVLLLGAQQMREELSAELHRRQISVTKVACYETLAVDLTDEQIALLGDADVVLIGAPSAWSVARDYINEKTWVAVPGATTKEVVAQTHERVLEAWGPSLGEALRALHL